MEMQKKPINHEAGSGVCINSTGEILTCYHCVVDEDNDTYHNNSNNSNKNTSKNHHIGIQKCLILMNGDICVGETIKLDYLKDLALLQIKYIYNEILTIWELLPTNYNFNYINCMHEHRGSEASIPMLIKNIDIVCIGQPGQDDLEIKSNKIIKTNYSYVHISTGKYIGLYNEDNDDNDDSDSDSVVSVIGYNIHDNTDIGQLMHDCWTYWGHSGAPLLYKGELMGLHSSWDDETCTRHGVHLNSILCFLDRNSVVLD